MLWQAAQDAAARAAAQISAVVDGGADPRLAGDAAGATADLLAVVAHLTERRAGWPYTDAARAFKHAGRSQHQARPLRTPSGRRLRTATTALSAVRVALPSESRQLLLLTQRLSRLVDAVARLHQTQAHAAQAAAARAAAEQLRTLYPSPVTPRLLQDRGGPATRDRPQHRQDAARARSLTSRRGLMLGGG